MRSNRDFFTDAVIIIAAGGKAVRLREHLAREPKGPLFHL